MIRDERAGKRARTAASVVVSSPWNSQVNRAADLMRDWRRARASKKARPPIEDVLAAIETIGQFRALFAGPLTKVVMGLRSFVNSEGVDPAGRVAQRLKRMPTILDKLERESGMNLARMHDIGGCRAILPDEATIYRVIRRIKSQPLSRRLGLKDGRGPESLQRLLELSAYAMEATSKGETMSDDFDREFEHLRQAALRELQ